MVNVVIDKYEADALESLGIVMIKNVSNAQTGSVQMVVELTGLVDKIRELEQRIEFLEPSE